MHSRKPTNLFVRGVSAIETNNKREIREKKRKIKRKKENKAHDFGWGG